MFFFKGRKLLLCFQCLIESLVQIDLNYSLVNDYEIRKIGRGLNFGDGVFVEFRDERQLLKFFQQGEMRFVLEGYLGYSENSEFGQRGSGFRKGYLKVRDLVGIYSWEVIWGFIQGRRYFGKVSEWLGRFILFFLIGFQFFSFWYFYR